jgi:hypothetical protein
MTMTGRALNAKLFLEGIEVPMIGATVSYTVNTAAIAYIDVVPHKSINNIKPRTLVHVFVRDFHNPEEGFPYVLMFEGEVFGIAFGKTTTSRTMTLSCIDYSSYWDNAIIYFMDPLKSLGKGAEELASEGMNQANNSKMGIPGQVVSHSTSSFFLQTISGAGGDFLDGLVAVYKKITKINSFFKLSDEKLHIVDRITLKSSGKLTELLQQDQARSWFEGIVGSFTGYQTLRMVVQDLMGIIFHDGVTIPFPALVGGKLIEFVFKPNLFMIPPPTCNIFYPDEYSSFNFNRNFFQEPTRLIYQPSLPVFGAGVAIKMPHTFAPDSFAHFMKAQGVTDYIGTGDLQISADTFGFYLDPDSGESAETNNGLKREQQFLTNEERMKGMLLTNETMMPAVTQFRGSVGQEGNSNLSAKIAKYLFFKKRFQQREVQITSHLKPSVVPGFNVMILDDSDADQTVLAYCSSVTHRVYANQGGYTNIQLSYARTVEEQDSTTGKSNEPLVPPWFDSAIFGTVSNGSLKTTTALNDFYKALLGNLASKSITGYANKSNITEATKYIRNEYVNAKAKGLESVNALIRKTTQRDYVRMRKTFAVIGGTTKTKDETTSWMEFTGMKTTDMDLVRKKIIQAYRTALKSSRGFRG